MVISGVRRHVAAASIVELVAGHARSSPDAIAVESGGQRWTFTDLWRRSGTVAAVLQEAGVSAGDRVVVWAHRSADTVAAALGTMMLGAAYVPVDPSHPAERTAMVVRSAAPAAILGGDGIQVPALPERVPRVRTSPSAEDIAYVVFTSGSTGVPKGVQVSHGSLVNYVSWCGSLVGSAGSGSALFGSLGYDLALTSLWVPLAHGRKVLAVKGIWDRQALFAPRPDPYTFLKLTPSHARFFELLEEPPDYRRLTGLLMFGGERLDTSLLAELGDRLAGVRLVNHYGPTETTIGCCAYRFDSARLPASSSVPIGYPAWNTDAHVLDSSTRPVAEGELVITGRAVAAGYLGDDPSGGGKFFDAAEIGGTGLAYRTGDLVRILPDGALLYLGRRDDQLKVSGHRVELGELRYQALRVPGVRDVAFEVVRAEIDTVEAFVVPEVPGDIAVADRLQSALAAVLPEGVVPSEVHVVAALSLNGNGKTDLVATRRQLSELSSIGQPDRSG